ncbi:YggT family protein [Thermoleophilum album]|uniref:YggT family protein n=1 Tax=Thermoleophilum album TaxID=29539 RepID=A0A1H6FVF0_THEAL|nr:YggT family protein [Thermoleophilum album]SEH14769.1 YggT family protein [Thermoleophilum album]
MIEVALTRFDVARYLETLLYLYVLLIFVRVLLSWVPRLPYNRLLRAVVQFVYDVTEPYLALFRRLVPMLRLGPAGLDLSPMVATIVLIFVGNLLVAIVRG